MTHTEHLINKLTNAYREIYKSRMSDMPMCHDIIGVHAIGFEPWENCFFGVMVTPWFMNLMLIPQDDDSWDDKKVLSEEEIQFPSGSYRFVVGYEESIGKYMSCSVFSIMHEFHTQEGALDTAQAILIEIMDQAHQEYSEFNQREVMERWQQQDELKDSVREQMNTLEPDGYGDTNTELDEEMLAKQSKTFSRRQLFGGDKPAEVGPDSTKRVIGSDIE